MGFEEGGAVGNDSGGDPSLQVAGDFDGEGDVGWREEAREAHGEVALAAEGFKCGQGSAADGGELRGGAESVFDKVGEAIAVGIQCGGHGAYGNGDEAGGLGIDEASRVAREVGEIIGTDVAGLREVGRHPARQRDGAVAGLAVNAHGRTGTAGREGK